MSLNKVQLIGNVGKDPEVRYLDSGVAVATFPRWLPQTVLIRWPMAHRCLNVRNGITSCCGADWLKLPKNMSTAKADKLYIEGKIRTRSYDDQNGVKRYVTEIFGDNMEMLTPRAAQPAAPAQPQAASPVAAAAQPENNPFG